MLTPLLPLIPKAHDAEAAQLRSDHAAKLKDLEARLQAQHTDEITALKMQADADAAAAADKLADALKAAAAADEEAKNRLDDAAVALEKAKQQAAEELEAERQKATEAAAALATQHESNMEQAQKEKQDAEEKAKAREEELLVKHASELKVRVYCQICDCHAVLLASVLELSAMLNPSSL